MGDLRLPRSSDKHAANVSLNRSRSSQALSRIAPRLNWHDPGRTWRPPSFSTGPRTKHSVCWYLVACKSLCCVNRLSSNAIFACPKAFALSIRELLGLVAGAAVADVSELEQPWMRSSAKWHRKKGSGSEAWKRTFQARPVNRAMRAATGRLCAVNKRG